MFQKCLTGIILLICSYTDIKRKRVYRKVVIFYLILALAGHILLQNSFEKGGVDGSLKILSGTIPGLFCLLLSWVTRQGFGYGDSVLILVCGVSLGVELCIQMVLSALFFAGLWAIYLLCRRKADRKKEIPFVPFLLLGALVQGIGAMV